MGSLGPLEIFLVFLVILLIFGAKRIPEIARGLGKGISEFKRATQDMASEFNVEDKPRIDRQQQRRRPSGQTAARGSAQQQAEPQPQPQQQQATQQQGQAAAQPTPEPNTGDADTSTSNDSKE